MFVRPTPTSPDPHPAPIRGSFYRRRGKRILDIALGGALLLLATPALIITALALAVSNHGKFLFLQLRPGLNGELFQIIKFKTMNDQRAPSGDLLGDEERLTTVGRLVRKASLDELLQLINVLRGEMSLVGPRPLLPEYLPLYSEQQARRHGVLPGITGLSQVSGRNRLPWEEKFALDVQYVDGLSIVLDLKILGATALQLVRPRGISAAGSATMPRFTGSSPDSNSRRPNVQI